MSRGWRLFWGAYYAIGAAGCVILAFAYGQWGWLALAAVGTVAGMWKLRQ